MTILCPLPFFTCREICRRLVSKYRIKQKFLNIKKASQVLKPARLSTNQLQQVDEQTTALSCRNETCVHTLGFKTYED